MLEDLRRLVEFQVHQDSGDDLRVLVLDEIGGGGRIEPLQALDRGGVRALHDAGDDVACLVVAQHLGEHLADLLRIGFDRSAALHVFDGLVQHRFYFLARFGRQRGHDGAQFLHFLGTEVLEHLGGLGRPQGEQQQGGAFDGIFTHLSVSPRYRATL